MKLFADLPWEIYRKFLFFFLLFALYVTFSYGLPMTGWLITRTSDWFFSTIKGQVPYPSSRPSYIAGFPKQAQALYDLSKTNFPLPLSCTEMVKLFADLPWEI